MKIIPTLAVASLALAGCMSAETGNSSPAVLPGVDRAAALQAIDGRCVSSPSRAVALTTSGTLTAHPVRLCAGGTILGHAVYWSGTNAEGTRLTTRLTSLQGDGFTIARQGQLEDGSNFTETVIDFADGGRHTCRFIKPSGGIAPLRQANCVAS